MGILLVRTAILYAIIVFALRTMGKRQLGELQPSEFVVTILVSNLATLTMEDPDVPLLGSMLPIFALVAYEVFSSYLILKSNRFRKLITGNSCVIIRDGEVDQEVMRDIRWSIDDLMEQLRIGGVFDIGEVACAIIETSGKLSVFKKQDSACEAPPMTVISDGEFVPEALEFCQTTEKDVEELLKGMNLKPSDVFILTLDRRGRYYLTVSDTHRKRGDAR